jgi:hypothetical protein
MILVLWFFGCTKITTVEYCVEHVSQGVVTNAYIVRMSDDGTVEEFPVDNCDESDTGQRDTGIEDSG